MFFILIELERAGVIQDFHFCFIFHGFLRGQCLSNKVSTLLKKGFGFSEGSCRMLFQSIFCKSFSNAFGSKLWNDLISSSVRDQMSLGWSGTRRNCMRWSEIEVVIFPEMILFEALLQNILSIKVLVVGVINLGKFKVG